MTEIIARRQFAPCYIYLDIAFLVLFASLLVWKKKYMTVLVGFVMGLVYMVVDYGIFHLICHSRTIQGGSMFWVLLWMSMSYGFTNFAWIWLWLSKDSHLIEWSTLILTWWLSCPMISKMLSHGEASIIIQRTTGEYHGWMAVILFVGYAAVIVFNLTRNKKEQRVSIPWILAIGVLVQFGWEASLLIGGIRSAGFESMSDKFATLVVNSLLETNLGMPYVYFIFAAITARFNEQLKRRSVKLSLADRIVENNAPFKSSRNEMN